jgi:excisionase family DNA binding protein
MGIEKVTYTADEVAVFLGISRRFVYELCQRNELPHRRVGKKLIFSRQQLTQWLNEANSSTPKVYGVK